MSISAKFLLSLDGTTWVSGPLEASKGAVVYLKLESIYSVNKIVWRCFGTSGPTYSIEEIQNELDSNLTGTPLGSETSFTFKNFSGGLGQNVLIECVINGQRNVQGELVDDLRYTASIFVKNTQGVAPLGVGESTEIDPIYSYTPRINIALNNAGGGGGGSLNPPTSSDNDKIAIADSEDLTYDFIKDINIASDAEISVEKLDPGNDGETLFTISGVPTWGNLPTFAALPRDPEDNQLVAVGYDGNLIYRKLADEHIASDAEIAVSKLDPGNDGEVLYTIGGVPSWGTLPVIVSEPDSGDDNKVAIAQSGDLTYDFIKDINIASDAEIAGSKIVPNFGTQTLTSGAITSSGRVQGVSLRSNNINLGATIAADIKPENRGNNLGGDVFCGGGQNNSASQRSGNLYLYAGRNSNSSGPVGNVIVENKWNETILCGSICKTITSDETIYIEVPKIRSTTGTVFIRGDYVAYLTSSPDGDMKQSRFSAVYNLVSGTLTKINNSEIAWHINDGNLYELDWYVNTNRIAIDLLLNSSADGRFVITYELSTLLDTP